MFKKLKLNPEKSGSGRLFHEQWTVHFGVLQNNNKVLCCLCNETVVSRSFNVKRHFETVNNNIFSLSAEEKLELISQKVKFFRSQSNKFKVAFKQNNNLSAASFSVSHCIAQHGKPLSDGEYLKEVFVKASNILFHDFTNKNEIIKRINDLPVSRNTVKDRIICMSNDITDLALENYFSICLDESTDVTSQARLAVFVRFSSVNIMREELVKLMTISTKTTGQDIMNVVLKEFANLKININNIVSITTDGAPNMVGKHNGFVQLFSKEISHSLIRFNCLIHQEALCAKDSLQSLQNVMEVVTKVVNFITSRALNNRQFTKLLDEVESRYPGLLMYNSVRWLSRGQVLHRFVELLEEIRLFLFEKSQDYPELKDLNWLNDLMFFTDFTTMYNELNKKLQGHFHIVLTMFENIKGFEKKIEIYCKDLKNEKFKYFPHLKNHLNNSLHFADSQTDIKCIIKKYVNILENTTELFSNRFSQFRCLEPTFQFLINPYTITYDELDLSFFEWLNIENLEMDLIEFQGNVIWRNKFINLNSELEKYYFTSMKKLALSLLTMFGSTYTCEQLFSSMNFIKSTLRNRLGTNISAACIQLKSTNYNPRIDSLAGNMQQQISH
ncbi:unnamed protein product [Macrosiphum euphorbiae]|uniref:Transposase n=1 Tax=Macrosiphum euphorbiae TaxID=13131 RepID=A0AAV0XRV3_9HEMI|nr:unnamed protein product [Macrosiphum euphorbiae]